MSMFDIKGGSSNGWNYSDSSKPGYMETIEGTVVEISNPQARDFATGAPAVWPDGNPKRNFQVIILGKSGRELAWTFSPKSFATDACLAALDPNKDRIRVNMEELLGKFIRVQTKAGSYNSKNPRPWWVTILGDGEANAVRGIKDLSLPQPLAGMPAPAPAPAPQPAPAPSAMHQAQAAAAAAVANQNFQEDPYGCYDDDIPF